MRLLIFLYIFLFSADTFVSAAETLDFFQIARNGNASQMREVIASGTDLTGKDASGRNALMQAVLYGNQETSLVLLENGIDLETRDELGLTPLTLSVRYGDAEMTRLLLEHGANVESNMEDGSTAVIFAALEGQL